jgi:hypothetical protein
MSEFLDALKKNYEQLVAEGKIPSKPKRPEPDPFKPPGLVDEILALPSPDKATRRDKSRKEDE